LEGFRVSLLLLFLLERRPDLPPIIMDLKTQLNNLQAKVDNALDLSSLLVKMCREEDFNKLLQLQKEFDNKLMIYKLEDELNMEKRK